MPPAPGSRRPPAKILPPDAPGLRALASLVTGVIVICALYFGRAVLIPIILAILLSFLLAPFVDMLRRIRFGQVPSVIVAVLLALSVLTAVGALIGAQVAQLAGDLPKYQVAVERKIDSVQRLTVGRADEFLGRASRALKRISPAREQEQRTAENNPAASPIDQPMPVEVHEPSPSPLELAQRFLSPVISPLETTGIVLVVAVFILLQREDLRDRLIRLFGSRDLHRATTAMDEAARRLSRYFLAQLGINVSVGIIISIGLAVIGVPGALLFGVMTALLRFVPYVGTWIAALVAVVFAAAVGPGWTMLIWTIVLFGVTDIVAGQIVEPLLYGHSTGLSPFAVIVAAIFWSWIWGPIGLVLSTPLTLCLVILGRHVDRLEFLDVLFGDRPALTPAENFYQRLLANDPDEALAQAESLLTERSLIAYYDEVALEGLRLAHNDVLRGVVTVDQLRRINESALDIIEGLEETDDTAVLPPPHREDPPASLESPDEAVPLAYEAPPPHFDAQAEGHTASVLCIAGRSELDDLAATIAVQLFRKHGLGADLAGYERFSRGRFGEVNLHGVSIICVVSFDAAESPPYLRNLLRRLHQRAPAAELIVGLVFPESPLQGEALVRTSSAAVSFKELVEACVAAARRQSTDGVSWTGLDPSDGEAALEGPSAPEEDAPALRNG
ncbi:AI-2E family transporter [Caballeronia sp. LP006]|jgi:predicted PurR-regulated permease PerM|uniref:AI-2E family transporter n=1 Tax=unclassified Caballeronia TaxID=2646786 RepID=UPI001FD55DE5|nr:MULTISPECIES: AI-2E family transporter [unclassified Caballeronia]MDR5776228.1 AI-2E family transporter [Caballeronia sp. LZ002]MDR5801141.1 AI-2E family transporter [Caballeronia sp. LZ001]MDR5829332.1 AI-2E family transporter [Caballeronia sp. LP006]MDR5851668.1 AI-2E family transporter [Caballeronia sp. LZ003]